VRSFDGAYEIGVRYGYGVACGSRKGQFALAAYWLAFEGSVKPDSVFRSAIRTCNYETRRRHTFSLEQSPASLKSQFSGTGRSCRPKRGGQMLIQ